MACSPFATIYYSNVFFLLQIDPHLLQFTYKHPENLPQNCNKKITQALIARLVTFRMSGLRPYKYKLRAIMPCIMFLKSILPKDFKTSLVSLVG